MNIELREAGQEDLAGHAEIPIAFLVDRLLEVGPGVPLDLVERQNTSPWLKDYDAEVGSSPASWRSHFDTSTWRVISAWEGAARVGGVVLLADIPGVDMLEGSRDLGLIWDLRVAPDVRGCGVGARLVSAAVEWARSHACRELKVETQNINVGACQFYESHGFEVRSIQHGAYSNLPDELQILLYRVIG